MTEYIAEVRITPRAGLLDPEGHAVEGALRSLEFTGVHDVRVGKVVRVRMDAESSSAAEAAVKSMCERLLANPVTEDFQFVISEKSN